MAKDEAADNRRPAPAWERRAYVARGLGELVPGLTRAAYRKRSPAGALLMTDWASIVGPKLALETEPRRLSGAQLTIACSGPVAMELQHVSGTLIERINTHAGRRLVERLRFVQDFSSAPASPVVRRAMRPAEAVAGLDGELGEALGRLLAAMRSR